MIYIFLEHASCAHGCRYPPLLLCIRWESNGGYLYTVCAVTVSNGTKISRQRNLSFTLSPPSPSPPRCAPRWYGWARCRIPIPIRYRCRLLRPDAAAAISTGQVEEPMARSLSSLRAGAHGGRADWYRGTDQGSADPGRRGCFLPRLDVDQDAVADHEWIQGAGGGSRRQPCTVRLCAAASLTSSCTLLPVAIAETTSILLPAFISIRRGASCSTHRC